MLGNTLESSRSVAREDIGAEEEDDNKKKVDEPQRDYFLGMYLLRISHEREADINNLIGFAKYLKEQNVDDIVIDVYGTGDYLNEFLDKIFDNEVEDYICYCGETSNPKNQMKIMMRLLTLLSTIHSVCRILRLSSTERWFIVQRTQVQGKFLTALTAVFILRMQTCSIRFVSSLRLRMTNSEVTMIKSVRYIRERFSARNLLIFLKNN